MTAEQRPAVAGLIAESGCTTLLPRGRTVLFSLVTAVFVLWGVANSFNHILIQQFMKLFALSRIQASAIQSAYYFGYALPAIPAALFMQRTGYKATLLLGLLLFAAGSICFWPAALVGRFLWFIVPLFILASGVSFLETSAGTFIQQMGNSATAALRVNLSQAFQSLGAVTGALVGTRFIFSGIEYNSSQRLEFIVAHGHYFSAESNRVIGPYVCLGVSALLLALLLKGKSFPSVETVSPKSLPGDRRIFATDPGFLGAWIAAFLYVGAQVGTWSFLLQYVQQFTTSHEKLAGRVLAGTLGAFGLGRFASLFLMRYVSAQRLLMIYSAINCVLLTAATIWPGWIGVWAIVASSFFMSIMYPTIFSYGLARHGGEVKIAGALMVTAISAGGIVPPLMAVISRHTGSFASAYVLPLISYCCICLFAGLNYRRVV